MSKSQNRTVDKHIIWSDMNLNPDDWRDSYKDFLEINEIDGNPNDEHGLYEYMVETNGEYLSDERENLNVQLAQPIIVIGDIGRWNGRVMGYKMIDSGNIKDCLYSDTDMTEWYVDRYGDLRADAVHHDGTNETNIQQIQGLHPCGLRLQILPVLRRAAERQSYLPCGRMCLRR